MADLVMLLAGLHDYRDTLLKHIAQVRDEHGLLLREWLTLESVYEGDAAREFKSLWLNTTQNFDEYINRAQQIIALLEERIAYLQEAERSGSS